MKFLSTSLVLLLCIIGVHNFTIGQNKYYSTPFFNAPEQEYFSRTVIKYKDFKLKGTLAVKCIKTNQKRAAIVSDFGNTLMDLEYKDGKIEVIYVIDDLNNYFILKRLKNIFALILKTEYCIKKVIEKEGGEKTYHSRFRRKKIMINDELNNGPKTKLIQRSFLRKLVTIFYDDSSIKVISNRSPLKITFDDITKK